LQDNIDNLLQEHVKTCNAAITTAKAILQFAPPFTTNSRKVVNLWRLTKHGRRQRGQGDRAPPGFSHMIPCTICVFQQALVLWKRPNSHQPS